MDDHLGDEAALASERQRYLTDGYALMEAVVPPDLVGFLTNYVHTLSEAGRLMADGRVDGSASLYGDPAFDTILAAMAPLVRALTRRRVDPTYSFVRLYMRNSNLHKHIDRPACEHSVSVHLASSDPATHWPLHMSLSDGKHTEIALRPGDGVLYKGVERPHWRDDCPVDWCVQLFLHFVDVDGPHKDERFDRRPTLGVPRGETETHA
ncbi:hypothetical protein [Candidatus Microthrix parvicella]|uniref:hypothetical protein n=1 Tax=Candidatus Neomicrothrix parvicella TaxID=41950 RepID=UPI000374A425|nr:hypothetical protein [Candidatus Microthrix parvicella]